jgi:hypothetical protein
MKILGVSHDEKYIFLDEGYYTVSEEDSFTPVFTKYGSKNIQEMLKIRRDNDLYLYENDRIDFADLISGPKKLLSSLLEFVDVNVNIKSKYLTEWEKKSDQSLFLLRESYDTLILEEKMEQEWENLGSIMIQEGFFGDVWSGIKGAGKWIGNKIIMPIINQGIIPFLRWVRRNSQTYAGIIIELILTFTPLVGGVKIIYLLFIILDIYEIITGDFDPKDPNRSKMPYIFLGIDIISWGLSGAVGKSLKAPMVAAKQSGKVLPKSLTWVFKKLKGVVSLLENAMKGVFGFLNKVFPKNKVVSSVASGFTNVMKNLGKQLGEITGVKATAQMAKSAPRTLLKRAGAGALIGVGLAEFFIEEQMKKGDSGPEVKKLQEFINFMSSQPEAKGFGITPIKVDGRYGDETVKQVSKFKKWIMSTGQYDVKNTDGTYVQPEIAQAIGVELQPSGFNKVVDWAFGKGAMNTFGTKLAQADQWTKKTFGDPTKNNKTVVSAA